MIGVYPKMQDSILWKRSDYLQTRLRECSSALVKIFPEFSDPQRLAMYLEKLDIDMRELLLDVDGSINLLYNRIQDVPEYLQDALVIVLAFSIIERLQLARKKYLRLEDWIATDDSARTYDTADGTTRDRLNRLLEVYFSKYGSARAACDFFEAYLKDDDKKALVRSYRRLTKCLPMTHRIWLQTIVRDLKDSMTPEDIVARLDSAGSSVRTEEDFLPECYGVTCYVDYGDCWPADGCRLDDKTLLHETLEKVVKRLLYSYRNAFVHEGRLPTLTSGKEKGFDVMVSWVLDRLNDATIQHTLDRQFLLRALADCLRNYFQTLAPIPTL